MPLSAKQKEEATTTFELFDKDNSGSLSKDELGVVMRSLGFTPSKAQVAALLDKYDKDNSGKLSKSEFMKLLDEEHIPLPPSKEQLAAAFKVFDKDGSGFISKEELKAAMQSKGEPMTDAEVDDMMREFDVDGDGKINYKEFVEKALGEKKEEPAPAAAAPAAAPAKKEPVRSKIDWAKVSAKLPVQKNAEEKAQRMEMFGKFDPNGNGYVSLAEVDKGIRDVLELDSVFDVKPVIMRSFQAAKSANDRKNKKGSHGPDYIEKCEFRLLLVYIRDYFEAWQMFDSVDSGDDSRIDLGEFKAAIGKINAWGLKVDDAEAEFKSIDKNGGGQILFDEFAHWALEKKLDLEDDDDAN